MKKTELKKVLKPLVKECIKEVLLEGGILTNIVAEVAQGMQQGQRNALVEARPSRNAQAEEAALQEKRELLEKQRQERIKKLNESAGAQFGGVNIFEGTTPINESAKPTGHSAPGALSGVDPSDSGVDISGLAALAGGAWKKTMENR